jgi:GT2 family glycosyltransferase
VKLSVVIATRDRASLLAGALDSLAVQRDAPPFEVIVADNGSSDDTPSVVAQRATAIGTGVRRIFVPEPNRGAARNRAAEAAAGDVLVFVDDDVVVPGRFLAAHARRHEDAPSVTVAGPIVNVPSTDLRPAPTAANASRAFLCTCNASLPRRAFESVGGFDERFDLYGWEDTDLGIRLRRAGVRRIFAWDAYLYHIKPPSAETLEAARRKVIEKARMAARLVAKYPFPRTRLATGAYGANLMRAALVVPSWSLPWYERLAGNERMPAPLRALARAQALDGAYVAALRSALRDG